MAWSCAATRASTYKKTAISYPICRASPKSAMRSGRGSSALHSMLDLTPLPCQLFSRPGPRSTCARRPRQPLIPSEQLACTARRYSCGLAPPPAMDGSLDHGWDHGIVTPGPASIDPAAPAGPASLRGTGGVSGGIYSGSLPALRRVVVGLACRCSSAPSRTTCGAAAAGAGTATALSLFQHNQCACTTTLFAETGIYSSSSASHAGAGPPAAGRPSYAGQPYVRHRRRALLLHAFRSVSCPSEHSARCVQ